MMLMILIKDGNVSSLKSVIDINLLSPGVGEHNYVLP